MLRLLGADSPRVLAEPRAGEERAALVPRCLGATAGGGARRLQATRPGGTGECVPRPQRPSGCMRPRPSSAANVDADKDSVRRQQEAVEAFAGGRYQIAATFYDAAVSGADPIDARPGFV